MLKKVMILLTLMLLLISGCNSSNQPVDNSITTGNVKDLKALYSYLSEKIDSLSEDTFKEYIPFYVDINKDGTMDVIFSTKEWYGELIYVLGNENSFSLLNSDKSDLHKINDIVIFNNFIIVSGENIDNGYKDERTDIYYYDNGKVSFLHSFITKLSTGAPPSSWQGNGSLTLADGYKSIEYSYEQYEENTSNNKKTDLLKINMAYKFDPSNISYTKTENGENYNYIENPKKVDNGSDNNNSNSSNEGNKANTEYQLTDLKNGDTIGEFTIENIHHDPKDYTSFSLKGDKWIKATIIYYSEGYEGYYFTAEEPILDKPIAFGSDWANFHTTYDRPSGAYMREEEEVLNTYFKLAHLKHLEEGRRIEVFAHIKDPSISVAYASEGGEGVTILDLKITNEDAISNEDTPFIKGFTNETVNGTEIDYSKYRCVIIPQAETINRDKLELQKLYCLDKINGRAECYIIGTLYDVTITYYEDMNDKGYSQKYDKFTNSHLTIRAPFTNDMSYIKIQGKIYYNGTDYEEIEVTIDTMRDAGDYEVIKH